MKCILVFIFILLPFQLFADELNSPFEQTEHSVSVDLKDTYAKVRIERTFKNISKTAEDLEFIFDLPKTAVVTKLEVFQGRWRKAETLRRQDAMEAYGIPAQNEKATGPTSVLLSKVSRFGKKHALYASPIAAGKPLKLLYDIEIPFEYKSGKHYFSAKSLFSPLSNSKPIILKTKDRFVFRNALREPGVKYSIFQTECEKLGAPDHCLIREMDVPFLKKPVFSAKYKFDSAGKMDSRKQSLGYVLVSPSSRKDTGRYLLRARKGKRKGESTIEETLGREIGKWRFAVWSTGTVGGKMTDIKISDGDQIYPSTDIVVPGIKSSHSSKVWIINSDNRKNTKTKMRLGEIKLSGFNGLYLNVEAAEKLSKPPKLPVLIFVIDTSNSQGYLGVRRQINVAKSITQHLGDHETQIVSYNRNAQKDSDLVSFADAFRNKPNAYLGNGSNLDDGLKLAAEIEKSIKKRPVIIYAMTDLLLKKSYTTPQFLRSLEKLRKSTVVHILNVQELEGDAFISVKRNDKIPILKIASAHKGVAVDVSIPSVYKPDPVLKELSTRYLTRPDRLEEIEIEGWKHLKRTGWSNVHRQTVLEGESLRIGSGWGKFKKNVLVTGKLWNKKVSFRVKSNKYENRRVLLSYVTSEETIHLEKVGEKGKVVTLFTPFYIGGSAKGTEMTTMKMDSRSRKGPHVMLGMDRGAGLFPLRGPKVFSAIAKRCKTKGKKETFKLVVETTLLEVVEVNKGNSPFSKCVENGVWETKLPDATKTGTYTFLFSSDGTIK